MANGVFAVFSRSWTPSSMIIRASPPRPWSATQTGSSSSSAWRGRRTTSVTSVPRAADRTISTVVEKGVVVVLAGGAGGVASEQAVRPSVPRRNVRRLIVVS